jgi:hypothetical protein
LYLEFKRVYDQDAITAKEVPEAMDKASIDQWVTENRESDTRDTSKALDVSAANVSTTENATS